MSEVNVYQQKNVPILQLEARKKGTKLGFWHRRFIYLYRDHIIVRNRKCSSCKEKIIKVTQKTLSSLQITPSPCIIIQNPDSHPCIFEIQSLQQARSFYYQLCMIIDSFSKLTLNNFRIVSVIGRGHCGKVLLCQERNTKKYYAIKSVQKKKLIQANTPQLAVNERNILKSVDSPFIVKLHFSFQSESKLYLGLQYAFGGELFHRLHSEKTLDFDEVRFDIAQICLALSYLHSKGIVYSDLKPENILIGADGYILLTDFGLSKKIEKNQPLTSFCGTLEYVAPEMVNKEPYGVEIDLWALGILTYELLVGKSPFFQRSLKKLYNSILKEEPVFSENMDPSAIDFIKKLLVKNPKERASFETLWGHPFFDGIDFQKLNMKELKPKYIPPTTRNIVGNIASCFVNEYPFDSDASDVSGDEFTEFTDYEANKNPTRYNEKPKNQNAQGNVPVDFCIDVNNSCHHS